MQVLLVSHSAALGGAELCVVELADALQAAGHSVMVAVPSEGPLVGRLAAEGIERLVGTYGRWCAFARPGTRRLVTLVDIVRQRARCSSDEHLARRILTDLAPDLVITNTITVPSFALAAERLGIRHVWLIHEYGEATGLRFAFGARRSLATVGRASQLVIYNSHAVRDHLEPLVAAKRAAVVHPAPPSPTLGERTGSNQRPIFLHLGFRLPVRAPDQAIDALAALAKSGDDAELWFVGAGSAAFDRTLRRRARREGVDDRVVFRPPAGNVGDVLAAADFLVQPCRAEAFGRVTVEAMKAGLAIIAADAGATREVVGGPENAILYQPATAEALAQAMRTAVHAPNDDISAMRARAQATALERWPDGAYGGLFLRTLADAGLLQP